MFKVLSLPFKTLNALSDEKDKLILIVVCILLQFRIAKQETKQ